MIAIRKCQKCKRRFDGVVGKDWRLCPVCAGVKNFIGDVTDKDVWEADTRNPCEAQFVKGVDVWPAPNRERAPEHSHYVRIVNGNQNEEDSSEQYMKYKGKDRKDGMELCGGKILAISADILPPSDWDPSLHGVDLLGTAVQEPPRKKKKKRPSEHKKSAPAPMRSNPYTGKTGDRSSGFSNMKSNTNQNKTKENDQ